MSLCVFFLTKDRKKKKSGKKEDHEEDEENKGRERKRKKEREKNEDHEEDEKNNDIYIKIQLNELVTAKSKQLNKQKCKKGEVPAVGKACKAIFWQNPGLKGADSFTSLGSR